jgi:hypothetical protein
MKSPSEIHSALLLAAAKKYLRPLGVIQRGRSRTWIADQGWWMVAVEFQPSNWSKGSYLNVGCTWLWNVKSYISFDEGSRVSGFQPFESREQFDPIAEKLAQDAANEVMRYRKLFPTVQSVSDYYSSKTLPTGWPSFNAAVAHGFSGRIEQAAMLLNHWGRVGEDAPEWLKAAQQDGKQLSVIVSDQMQFRKLISERVAKARELHKLPAIEEISFWK